MLFLHAKARLLGEAFAHDSRRRLVLLKINPRPIAVMAIENFPLLVDIDGHHHAPLRNVSLAPRIRQLMSA